MAKTTLDWDDIKNPVNSASDKKDKYSKYADIAVSDGLKRALYSVYQDMRDNEFWIDFSSKYMGKSESSENTKKKGEDLPPPTTAVESGNATNQAGKEDSPPSASVSEEKEDSGSASPGISSNSLEGSSQSSDSLSSSPDHSSDKDNSSISDSELQKMHNSVDRIGEDDLPEDENEETPEDISDLNPEITPNEVERYKENPKIILEGSGSASMSGSYKSPDEDSETSNQTSKQTTDETSEATWSLAGSERSFDSDDSSTFSASAFGDTNSSLSGSESDQETLYFKSLESLPILFKEKNIQSESDQEQLFLDTLETLPALFKEKNKQTLPEKLDSISDNINETVNNTLDTIASKFYKLSKKPEEDNSSFLGRTIKSTGRKFSRKLAVKLKNFAENKRESDEKEKEIREEKKQEKEDLKEEKKRFKKMKKQYDEYNGSELVKKIIENDLQNFQNNNGLFDPEVLKLVISDLKILSKKGPCPELFERLIKKFSYLSSNYNPRKEPSELSEIKFSKPETDNNQEKSIIFSENANEYLLDKYEFINKAEKELKLVCATAWNSINSSKKTNTHTMGKNNNYKATIAFCGSIMREEGEVSDKNSCRYEYEVKKKMVHEYMLKKQALDDSGYGSKYGDSEDFIKNNIALARTFAIILANENFATKTTEKAKPTGEDNSTLEELTSGYCINWYDFKNENYNVSTKDFKNDIKDAIGQLERNYTIPESLKQMKNLLENLDVKKASNLKERLSTIFNVISPGANDISSNKDSIIKSMFEDPKYFDQDQPGNRYIKKQS